MIIYDIKMREASILITISGAHRAFFTLYICAHRTEMIYFQCNLGCGRVRTGLYGCIWVCMGAVGCNGTIVQGNKTKGDTNESTGYAFDACMAGKFPEKNIYVRTDIKG